MRFNKNGKAHGLYKFRSMNEARDNPGVIAPPPLIALATLVLGLTLDWFLSSFILRGIFGFWTRLIAGAILMGIGALRFVASAELGLTLSRGSLP